jgi:5-methylcytosine-specific restriction endonuclease McrA
MIIDITQLTNEALLAETKRAAALERRTTAELLTLLIEVERRALHLALGYSSMFVYCTRVLMLSEQAAFKRITAARAAERHPVILERLIDGELTLSSIRILAPHLTDETADSLLDAARHKSTREVEHLVATTYPQPDIPPSVRALPAPKAVVADHERASGLLDCEPVQPLLSTPVVSVSMPRLVVPLAPRRYLVRVTVSQETYDKLIRARALLRHRVPDGDLAEILDRALTLLVQGAKRSKLASTPQPRPARAASEAGRYVPAAVKRAVWTRDAGCCAFIGADGRCGETGFLEFHHVVPFSTGGKTNVENLELRCRAHNQHEASIAVPDSSTRRAAS